MLGHFSVKAVERHFNSKVVWISTSELCTTKRSPMSAKKEAVERSSERGGVSISTSTKFISRWSHSVFPWLQPSKKKHMRTRRRKDLNPRALEKIWKMRKLGRWRKKAEEVSGYEKIRHLQWQTCEHCGKRGRPGSTWSFVGLWNRNYVLSSLTLIISLKRSAINMNVLKVNIFWNLDQKNGVKGACLYDQHHLAKGSHHPPKA